MGAGASFAFGPLRPLPCGRGGLLCIGIIEAPPRWRGGLLRFGIIEAPSLWAWGLLRFGATEAPSASAWGPNSLWDHRGTLRMGVGASLALGSSRPPPNGRGGLFRVWIFEALAARAWGPLWGMITRRGSRTTVQGLATCMVVAGAQAWSPSECCGWQRSSTAMILACSNSGTFPVGKLPRESVSWSTHGHLRQECCAVGVGIRLQTKPPSPAGQTPPSR